MKKFLLLASICLFYSFANAQTNIQEMYDFGNERGYLTTTLEMFKTDNWGSTFFFVDIYHNSFDNSILHSPIGAYTEIARSLNFWQKSNLSAFSLHVEYNGGLGIGYGVNNAWLFGAEYFAHSKNFNNTLTLEVLYKTIASATSDLPLQLTMVWGCKNILGVKGLTFAGFADFWWENISWGLKQTSTVFITEPQLWYNVGRFFKCENLNIGGEVEIANNFTGNSTQGWWINPCLGVKWNF